jgi:hypothetical protein
MRSYRHFGSSCGFWDEISVCRCNRSVRNTYNIRLMHTETTCYTSLRVRDIQFIIKIGTWILFMVLSLKRIQLHSTWLITRASHNSEIKCMMRCTRFLRAIKCLIEQIPGSYVKRVSWNPIENVFLDTFNDVSSPCPTTNHKYEGTDYHWNAILLL